LVKLKSSLRKFYGRHHNLVDRYGKSLSQMTTNMFRLTKVHCLQIYYFILYFVRECAGQFIGEGKRSTRRKPLTCCKSLANFITQCCIEYTSPRTGFKHTTVVVIGSDCTGSCKSNYHTITTTTYTIPFFVLINTQDRHILVQSTK
jgi:hypothetical protein